LTLLVSIAPAEAVACVAMIGFYELYDLHHDSSGLLNATFVVITVLSGLAMGFTSGIKETRHANSRKLFAIASGLLLYSSISTITAATFKYAAFVKATQGEKSQAGRFPGLDANVAGVFMTWAYILGMLSLLAGVIILCFVLAKLAVALAFSLFFGDDEDASDDQQVKQ
jgi:hypothetical protein